MLTNNNLKKFFIHNFFVQGVVASIFVLVAIIIYSYFYTKSISTPKEEQLITLATFQENASAVIGEGIEGMLDNMGENSSTQSVLVEFPGECDLVRQDQDYYIEDSNNDQSKQWINSDYPIFVDQGASLYLYHENFTLYTGELKKQNAKINTYLSQGMSFNSDKVREGNDNYILLQLPTGLFMNLSELNITLGDYSYTVEANSIMKVCEDKIIYCNLFSDEGKVNSISVEDSSMMVYFGEKRYTYDMFHESIDPSEDITSPLRLEEQHVNDALYQYFLGAKYEYNAGKYFLWTKEGYMLEMDDKRFLLSSDPLYYKDEQKILLPCDYELVQPKFFSLNKLPAMTMLQYRDGVVYTSYGDQGHTFQNIVLFDGDQTYIFFDNTVLRWGEEEVLIPPLSSVSVGEDGTIGIYHYDNQEYLQYQVDGYQEVKATVNDDIVFNLSTDIWYRSDGQEQLLFSEPSLLPEVK